jgi:hypothetical protein
MKDLFDTLFDVVFVGFWIFVIWWLRRGNDWIKLQKTYRRPMEVCRYTHVYWLRVGGQAIRSCCKLAVLRDDPGGISLKPGIFLRLFLGLRTLYIPSSAIRHETGGRLAVKFEADEILIDIPNFSALVKSALGKPVQ